MKRSASHSAEATSHPTYKRGQIESSHLSSDGGMRFTIHRANEITPRKDIMQTFGEYLQNLRKDAKLSQGDVAKHFGFSTPQFVSNWERGVSHPPVMHLKTLAKLYKTSADTLFEHLLEETIGLEIKNLKRKFSRAR